MKAARYYGPGDVRIEQIPEPNPKARQVKIKIAWNGICGTDLHCYLMPFVKSPTKNEPDVLTGETLPITLGHEFSGTVVELGPDTDSKFHVGQSVVVEPVISCMKSSCTACNAGTRNLCPIVNCIGIGGGGGGLAEYIAVDETLVHVLPDGIPLEVGALIEPLAVAWYAVKRSGFDANQKVLITGAGPIGLLLLKVIRSISASTDVYVSEPTSKRRSFASAHGATKVFDPNVDNIVAELSKIHPEGVDIVFDAAGAQQSMDVAVFAVRPRGKIVVVAAWEKAPSIEMNLVLIKEITITATNTYTGIHPELISAIGTGGFTNLDGIITSKIDLDDLVELGIKKLLHEKESQVKILVHP